MFSNPGSGEICYEPCFAVQFCKSECPNGQAYTVTTNQQLLIPLLLTRVSFSCSPDWVKWGL